jgi:hypothetical protein
MTMKQKLKTRLNQAYRLTQELVVQLDESSLLLDLPKLPSNRIAGQLWCVVGARESYAGAIKAGQWQGFSCSLDAPSRKDSMIEALKASHQLLTEIEFTELTDTQLDLAFALLEHEIQHHGQLIRFVYGNGLTFPKSWNERYTV